MSDYYQKLVVYDGDLCWVRAHPENDVLVLDFVTGHRRGGRAMAHFSQVKLVYEVPQEANVDE